VEYPTGADSPNEAELSSRNGDADPEDDDLANVPCEVLAEAEAAALTVIDRYRRQREGEADD
jgi:hypothetical protein